MSFIATPETNRPVIGRLLRLILLENTDLDGQLQRSFHYFEPQLTGDLQERPTHCPNF
jgi:hypothetical protein